MAEQVCPQCRNLFTEREGRYRRASWPRGWVVEIWLIGVALLVSPEAQLAISRRHGTFETSMSYRKTEMLLTRWIAQPEDVGEPY